MVSGCFTIFYTSFSRSANKSDSSFSLWSSMSMHAPNKTRKQKSPPWPQLLKDTVNVYVRMKPALLQHLSNRYSNHQVVFSEVLKCPFLRSLKAGSFAELNNQNCLHVCYARSIGLSDVTWLPEDRRNIFLIRILTKVHGSLQAQMKEPYVKSVISIILFIT